MSGVGITYLWASNEFPSFVRLEGKRGDYEVYVPERTCENLSNTNYFHCSECNERTYSSEDEFNYCPNCGAKVVGIC